MKVYISGKISGIEESAYQAFESAEKLLSGFGFEVVNPMKLPHKHDKSWSSYMKEDIKALLDCDAIYMLIGWEKSQGACIERNLCIRLGIVVLHHSDIDLSSCLAFYDNLLS